MALEYIYPQGGTDISIYVTLVDTNADAVTGLTASDLSAHYLRPLDASPTAISLSDLAGPDSAHSDGGLAEVDSTNMPGLYRLDLPDAAAARGENFVVVTVTGSSIATAHGVVSLDAGASQVQGNVNDTGATATSFVTDLAGGADDIYNDMFLLLPNRPEVSKITDWVDSSKTITVEALSSAPADNDPIVLIHNP